jgi:hypothetical protein
MIYVVLPTVFLLISFLMYRYKERSIYVLFLAAYTQNFVVPFLYTHKYIGKDTARGLIAFKDLLLAVLFFWSLRFLVRRFRRPWPRPLTPLVLFTGYCVWRFLVGVSLSGEDWSAGLHVVKDIVFPLQILVVAMTVAAVNPTFGRRFLRDMTYILSALAVIAVVLFLWAPPDFWVDNANIAELQTDVKGDSDRGMYFDEGLPGNATMTSGREMLQFLSMFRANGTFGEGIALGFSMAVPVLLFSLYFATNTISIFSCTAAVSALLFSLTRSAWIFCIFVGIYVLLRRHSYRILAAAACLLVSATVTLFVLWPPMAEFAENTFLHISPAADNPDSEHAEGVLWFYTHGFSDVRNVFGKGLSDEDQEIPESGYAYLLERFGVVAYATFMWFCVSLYRQLCTVTADDRLAVIGQGIVLGMLVVMHFSQYPFSLPTFMSLWYIVGLCLSRHLVLKDESGPALVRQVPEVPNLQPA